MVKKLLLLAAFVATMCANAFANMGPLPSYSLHLEAKGQWAAYGLSKECPFDFDTYVGYEIEVANVEGPFNILVESIETHITNPSWAPDTEIEESDAIFYDNPVADGIIRGELKNRMAENECYQGIRNISIQACESTCAIDILSVVFITPDGKRVRQALGNDAWGGDAYDSTEITDYVYDPDTYTLPLTSTATNDNAPMYQGWNSTYAQATKTITYSNSWAARGWSYSYPLSAADFTNLVVKFAESNVSGQIVVEYSQLVYDEDGNVVTESWGAERHESSVGYFSAGDTEVNIELNPLYSKAINSIVIQCSDISGNDNPTIVMESAQLLNVVEDLDYPCIYIIGNISDWTEPAAANAEFYENYKLDATFEGSKIYTGSFDFSNIADQGFNPIFRFYTQLTGWDGGGSYGPQVADSPIEFEFEDGTFSGNIVAGKGSYEMVNYTSGIINITVDMNNMTVLFENEIEPVAEPVWSLAGDFNAWSTDANLFVLEDGKYTLHVDELTTGMKIVRDGSWIVQYGASSLQDILTVGETFQLTGIVNGLAPANINFAANIAYVSDATITFDPENETLLVNGTVVLAEEPDNSCIYIVGNISGWQAPTAVNSEYYEDYKLNETAEGSKIYTGSFDFSEILGYPTFRFYTALTGWDVDSYGSQLLDAAMDYEFDADGLIIADLVSGKGSFEIVNYIGGDINITVDMNRMEVTFEGEVETMPVVESLSAVAEIPNNTMVEVGMPLTVVAVNSIVNIVYDGQVYGGVASYMTDLAVGDVITSGWYAMAYNGALQAVGTLETTTGGTVPEIAEYEAEDVAQTIYPFNYLRYMNVVVDMDIDEYEMVEVAVESLSGNSSAQIWVLNNEDAVIAAGTYNITGFWQSMEGLMNMSEDDDDMENNPEYVFVITNLQKKETTIDIDAVGADNDAVEYYNLQGIKIANPQTGNVYIRMSQGRATKALVK